MYCMYKCIYVCSHVRMCIYVVAEALDNKKGWLWGSKKGATLLPIGKKDGKKPKGDKQHQKAATIGK